MITTTEFVKLSSTTQHAIIMDGLLYVKIRSRQLSLEMDRLNYWVASIDPADVSPDLVDRFTDLVKELSENLDGLTESIVKNAQATTSVSEAIQLKRSLSRLNKTPQP